MDPNVAGGCALNVVVLLYEVLSSCKILAASRNYTPGVR